MAIITTIPDVEPFFPGEHPSHEKFTEEFTDKVDIINTNHVIINNALGLLLQGVSGGAEQAKIPFALASAPDGWTRDVSFTTDHLLRVTDGSTVPPGASATAIGGAQGGGWILTVPTMVSAVNHDHTMNGHGHNMAHTHNGGSHTHAVSSHSHTNASHTHAVALDAGGNTSAASLTPIKTAATFFPQFMAVGHTHSATTHNHGGMTAGAGSNVANTGTTSGADGTLSGANPDGVAGNSSVSSGDGVHTHTPSHDATFRPKYLNMIICSKD